LDVLEKISFFHLVPAAQGLVNPRKPASPSLATLIQCHLHLFGLAKVPVTTSPEAFSVPFSPLFAGPRPPAYGVSVFSAQFPPPPRTRFYTPLPRFVPPFKLIPLFSAKLLCKSTFLTKILGPTPRHGLPGFSPILSLFLLFPFFFLNYPINLGANSWGVIFCSTISP